MWKGPLEVAAAGPGVPMRDKVAVVAEVALVAEVPWWRGGRCGPRCPHAGQGGGGGPVSVAIVFSAPPRFWSQNIYRKFEPEPTEKT